MQLQRSEYEENTRSNFRKINYHNSELSGLTGKSPDKWIDKMNYEEFMEYMAKS
jgi:hypothetical protein